MEIEDKGESSWVWIKSRTAWVLGREKSISISDEKKEKNEAGEVCTTLDDGKS